MDNEIIKDYIPIEFNDKYYRDQWSLTSTKPYNKELVIYEKINTNRID